MTTSKQVTLANESSTEVPYFSPKHDHSPGAALAQSSKTPTLFQPLKIRNVTLRNRILVAPMCQYSTAASGPDIGALTDYHIATLGHYALKGAALVFIEATGVQANGRISPNCPGLWDDAQIPALQRVAGFIKSQGSLCGIQLAHAGRKASTIAPWLSGKLKQLSTRATREVGGWPEDVVGPTGGEDQAWDGKGSAEDGGFYPPRALSVAEIKEMVQAFAAAARRAVEAGVDVIEIHAAHGYLLHQFLSPITNRRTDEYGGSFENRTRMLVEVLQAVRQAIPEGTPLFLRISATEWLEKTDIAKQLGSWDLESTLRLAKLLPKLGVDLLDVSSGGNHPLQSINPFNSRDYQTRMASQIREAVCADGQELLLGAVGLIIEAEQARNIVQADGVDGNPEKKEAEVAVEMTDAKDGRQPMADVVLVARQFMREPEWVLRVAAQLGVEVAWPSQFLRVRFMKL